MGGRTSVPDGAGCRWKPLYVGHRNPKGKKRDFLSFPRWFWSRHPWKFPNLCSGGNLPDVPLRSAWRSVITPPVLPSVRGCRIRERVYPNHYLFPWKYFVGMAVVRCLRVRKNKVRAPDRDRGTGLVREWRPSSVPQGNGQRHWKWVFPGGISWWSCTRFHELDQLREIGFLKFIF